MLWFCMFGQPEFCQPVLVQFESHAKACICVTIAKRGHFFKLIPQGFAFSNRTAKPHLGDVNVTEAQSTV